MRKGDIVRCVTGTGGGWGHARNRSAKALEDDIKNGFVTPEQAVRYYGRNLAAE